MKTLMKNVLSAVAIALGVASCQVEIENPVDNNAVTHKVSIVTSEPQTKTSAAVDKVNGTVSYSWTAEDATKASERFVIYENGVAATSIDAIVDDGKMYIEAVFAGETPAEPVYTGIFNSGVKSVQLGNDTSYDQESDVLYASPVTSLTDGCLVFCFSRMVAVNEVKLCDLAKGALLGDIIIENKDAEGDELTGTLNTSEMVYENGETEITLSQTASLIEGGEASAKFITVPVQNVGLKFTAVALDEDSKFVTAYEKTFADAATISFQQGKYTSFAVEMVEKTEDSFDLTTTSYNNTVTDELICWESTLVQITNQKGDGTKVTNYYPGNGKSETRFYNKNTLTITPKHGASIKSIVFETSDTKYAAPLAQSEWTNATATASDDKNTVTVRPVIGTAAISAAIGATTGHTSITVYYGDPNEVIHVESVSLDRTSASLVVGQNLTLTATINPNDAANKNVNWTSSATGVATVDENGVVTAISAGEATITATTVDGELTAQCDVTVTAPSTTGNGSVEDPYTVADAIAIANALEENAETSEVYVSGNVYEVTGISTYYNNMTFTMGEESANITAYRLKDLGGDDVTTATTLESGQSVVVYGKLKKYVKNETTTLEVVSGNLYSVNGQTFILKGISLGTKKTSYTVGDEFEKPQVYAEYRGKAKEEVAASNITCTGYNMSTAGEYTVTVSCLGYEVEYGITVAEEGAGVTIEDGTVLYSESFGTSAVTPFSSYTGTGSSTYNSESTLTYTCKSSNTKIMNDVQGECDKANLMIGGKNGGTGEWAKIAGIKTYGATSVTITWAANNANTTVTVEQSDSEGVVSAAGVENTGTFNLTGTEETIALVITANSKNNGRVDNFTITYNN